MNIELAPVDVTTVQERVYQSLRLALLKGLCIGVRDDEFAAFELLLDHVIDCVAACTTDTNHRDPGAEVLSHWNAESQCHVVVRLFRIIRHPRTRANDSACSVRER